MTESGEQINHGDSQTEQPEPPKTWRAKSLEKIESFYMPKDQKQIRERNLALWNIQDATEFTQQTNQWITEIRDGDGKESQGLKALRGDSEESPHVSIVIPAHNEERYILQLLQSLAKQKYEKGVEVIVVDNNSTLDDKTKVFAEECGAKVISYTVAEATREEESQIALARQKGLQAASGDIVMSTDADALISPTWIASMTEDLDNNPGIAAVTGGIVHYDRPDQTTMYARDKAVFLRRISALYFNMRYPKVKLARKSPTYGANSAFRRADVLAVGGYDPTVFPGEDTELGHRLSSLGKLKFINNKDTRVRVSPRRFGGMGALKMTKQVLTNYKGFYKGDDGAPIIKR